MPHLAFQPDQVRDVPVLPIEEVITSYYLRMRVDDKPGVLADITRILAESGISIEALSQKEAAEGESQTDIIMLTHQTVERSANAAIARIEALPVVSGKVTKLRLSATVIPNTVPDGLHGDVFAVGAGDDTGFFALSIGRRIELRGRAQ